ncbi:MAG: carboxypeptidase regulatory-like domain-containing protein [Candidatus Acidiferrales bacterium]
MRLIRLLLIALLASTVFAIGAQNLLAQTANTGALTGTVTDPSGGVIAGATVKVTNLATGQTRTTTTDSKGSYQISLLPPGNYSVHFEATGFRSTDVPSIAVNVTETVTLNRELEIGTSTQQVTVEANTQSIQTQNATNGTVVSGQEINALPLVTRNYTQIVDLSPGVVTNVSNASSMGNGTQNVSANGQGGISNSYSMDGANITQYTSGGAAQMGSMPGIAIPNPDTIQEFKVQTSQYDAGYGRNSGANVEVITKTGSNNFHGDLWEYNRNNFFNANDFFYKHSELKTGLTNTPQILKQNTFGFTLGGPVLKQKILFFGSYQGYRQINGIATNGFASGYEPAAVLMPWNDYADMASGACADLRCSDNIPAYRAYLGSVFGPGTASCPASPNGFGVPGAGNCNTGWADGVTVANDGSNITNTAIALLQAKGPAKGGYNQGGYWIASALASQLASSANCPGPGLPSSGCTTSISLPTHANENQYMINSQYNLSSKNTVYQNFFYQTDPEIQSFDCLFGGTCNPGSPADVVYDNYLGTLRWQSILTPNFINEARFTFQRNLEDATDPNPLKACNLPNNASIIPLNNNGQDCSANVKLPIAYMGIVPSIDVLGLYSPSSGWSQGGNFAGVGANIDNEFQVGDQVSWNHGMHTLRAGFDWEFDQYNNSTIASARGEVLFDNTADFLTSSSGPAIDGTPQTGLPPTAPPPFPALGCGFLGFSNCAGGAAPIALRGLLTHYNRISAYDWFVQDDIKVNSKLTVNAGLRWEYDGWPSDKIGQFTNIWTSQLALVNTGSFFLNDPATACQMFPGGPLLPVGTLAGFVVPKNYDRAAGFTNSCGSTGVKVNSNNSLFSGSPLHDFQPRLGVAWQPFGNKLVVRAGYGWFYDRAGSIYLVDNLLNLPPYGGTINGTSISNLENTLHSPFQAVVGIPLTWTQRYFAPGVQGSPGSYNLNGYNAFGTLNYSALGFTANSNQMSQRLPLTQAYNLDLQYDVGHGWVVDVGYVGSHSIHILSQGSPTNSSHLVDCSALGTPACHAPTNAQDISMFKNPNFPGGNPIPYNDPANPQPVTINTTQNIPARVSYLGYTAGALTTTNTNGDGLYNSLQAQVRHNFSHGILLQAAYTWSKNLTNVNSAEPGLLDVGQTDFGTTGSNNPLDHAQQYGPYSGERTQRLIVSYSYDLPWKSTQGFSGKLLGGWTVSGVTTIQNGQPFTVTDGGGGSIYGGSTSRALLASPVDCGSNGVCKSGLAVATPGSTTARVESSFVPGGAGWINKNAFTSFATIPITSPYCIGGFYNAAGSTTATCGSGAADYQAAGTGWGNAPVGIVTGPGQWNWDLSLQKNTKVTEWGTLQFRAEFYNMWNHAQFSNPASTAFTSATFGVIQSTSVTPRVIQFGLKFLF